jgi:hypothetical protein
MPTLSQPSAGNATTPPPRRRQNNWTGLLFLTLTILAIDALCYSLTHPRLAPQEITKVQLLDLVKAGQVMFIANEPDPTTGARALTGSYTKPVAGTNGRAVMFKLNLDPITASQIANELQQAGYNRTIETRNNTNIVWPLLIQFLPVLLTGILLVLVVRSIARFLLKLRFGPGGS